MMGKVVEINTAANSLAPPPIHTSTLAHLNAMRARIHARVRTRTSTHKHTCAHMWAPNHRMQKRPHAHAHAPGPMTSILDIDLRSLMHQGLRMHPY